VINSLRAAWLITWATVQRRRSSTLTFAGIAAAFHFITAMALDLVGGMDSVQSDIKSYSPGIQQLLKIPPELQAAYSEQIHFALTWLHPFFIGLCAIFVVGRSAEALAKDVETGSVYLVLSRPIPRWALVLGRVGEVAIGLAVILLLSWMGLTVGVWLAGLEPLPIAPYAMLVLTAWCLFMALSALALIISSVASRTGIAIAIGTVWTLVTYVLDVIPQTAQSPLAWLNPWHHYFPPFIIAGESAGPMGLLILLGWTVAATLVAMALFAKRDLA
jgi:ABC-type transport system involved in multi-copper enzyme maturation permease subunit